MTQVLPPLPALVLDIGCGTGTLSVLLAELGYEVLGVDLSPRMLEQAALKAARHRVAVRFELGDAARPEVDGSFDVVLSRHVLWALPDARPRCADGPPCCGATGCSSSSRASGTRAPAYMPTTC